jgi:hypothetical protein
VADDFNPYQAPEAPVVEDFIAVEPRRRPDFNVMAAVTCFSISGSMLAFESFLGYLMIAYPPPANFSQSSWLWRMLVFLGPMVCASLAFLLAGREFWRMQVRPAAILTLTAVGVFVFGILAVMFLT